MRAYFYSLMTDKRRGPAAAVLKLFLWLCSLAYGLLVRNVSSGYEKNVFTPYKADSKVISIGNITVGGTGKTQAAISVARLLESRGKRVSILMRGYGSDECVMLQEELKDIPILVGADRIRNSKRAFYDFGADTVILDDGFQHWRIARDIDIVLLDATNPFGNRELIPRGILREPVDALKRADIIIITKVDSPLAKLGEVYGEIAMLGKSDCVLESVYAPVALRELRGGGARDLGLEFVRGKKICLVSSIGNPAYFKDNMARLGAAVELEYIFMDHYNYRKKDFENIEKESRFFDIQAIVVTKKDAVKIKRLAAAGHPDIPILVLDVEFRITKNGQILNDRLSGLYSS